jgi:type II secretory pathway pseudopilin PulG
MDVRMTGLHLRPASADLREVMRRTTITGVAPPAPRSPRSEAGFLLVEVMVSAVVLVVLALATLQLIDRSGRQSGSDRSRGVATAIAQADQDRLRSLKPAALFSYGRATSTKLVGGVNYSITSDVALTRDAGSGTGATVCDTGGTARAEYFRILSTVSWPNQGSVQPVAIATILSQGVGDPTKGSATVKLLNEAGDGVPGATVTTAGLTAVTDEGGCASFSNLSPGNYNFAWTRPGYVDKTGAAVGGKTATVSANQNASISDNFDVAATIPVTVGATDGTAATWPSFTIASASNNFIKRVTATGYPQAVTSLYPFSAGYAVYAGTCPGNQPDQSTYLPSYYGLITNGSVVAGPGVTTAALTAYTRHVRVPVTVGASSTAATFTYKITPDSGSSGTTAMKAAPVCSEGVGATPVASRSATVDEPLPWGTYNVCAQATFPSGGTRNITSKVANLPASPWSASQAAATGSAINLASGTSGSSGGCP